jgi:hypothetical protein
VAASAKLVHEVLQSSDLELAEYDSANLSKVDLSDIKDTIVHLGAKYIDFITEEIINQDLKSSGDLERSLQLTELSETGGVYSVGIKAAEYASYLDEGVNGWKVNRGSRFQFKTKGTREGSPMFMSLKQYVNREGLSARNVKVGISSRERRGMKLQNVETKQILALAATIKRQGIKPKRFWTNATEDFTKYAETELGVALKIDIINNLTT